MRLANTWAAGYGWVGLYSSAQDMLGGLNEAEEVARLHVNTIPEPDEAYLPTLRRLLSAPDAESQQRPSLAILLSWSEPWNFLRQLRAWLALVARALDLDSTAEEPLPLLKELRTTVVVQQTAVQESLERDGWTEERFDYVSQVLRTILLPLNAALVYTSSTAPPPAPSSALSNTQSVLFSSLNLDLATLSSAQKKDESQPHNVVDRSQILVPAGWDSIGKIRVLSETFNPEPVLESWQTDLHLAFSSPAPLASSPESDDSVAGAEQDVPSAVTTYETHITNPKPVRKEQPQIEVSTQDPQDFLREMKATLDELAAKDSARQSVREAPAINTDSSVSTGALSDLGAVSFNLGGVNIDAEAAISRLKNRDVSNSSSDSPVATPTPRHVTPRPQRREDREGSETPKNPFSPSNGAGTGGKAEVPMEDLEKYFASLMKKGGGSGMGTPTRRD